ncbi:DUF5685 family protein [Clostridium sp. L74]|uniref:DUF5685 family protein n=1 Tax=Clostridium sp. L74 TaxID=1560217 RepID=UPI0006ABC43A|nr:DUF5685 family protein [Clostridium sp. L74]KOR25581.1 hypothetical protein ND00_14300 [Clostridium sp. L74]
MFGYVTPCKMELKIKEYEKFRAYYCGLCKTIKKDYGELPRITINYDMTFLGILLDSLEDNKNTFTKVHCIIHPIKKKVIITNNEALKYASFFNVALSYYKLLDNIEDDNSIKSNISSKFLKKYIHKNNNLFEKHIHTVDNSLKNLYNCEKNYEGKNIDEISHHFAHLTGYILSSYKDFSFKDSLYWLGYNLGKWIYIIDAFDDLEKDMNENKFNVINNVYNKNNLNYKKFRDSIKDKADFLLVNCANACLNNFKTMPIVKNKGLLYNILQFGLMEKMERVLKGVNIENESL